MDNLPREIIVNILSRLPIKPLLRCKSVCKSFLNLTRDPYFINTHLNHASSHIEENPSLILNCCPQLFYTTQTLTNSSRDIISFLPPRFQLLGSCNGLICLLHRTLDLICVINPCTGDSKLIEIPRLMIGMSSVGMGIGFSPKSNEYKVVMFSSRSASYVFSLSEGVWRAVEAPSFEISGDLDLNVYLNGVVHWASYSPSNSIVCFDVADEVFDVIPYPAGGLRQGRFSLAVFSECLGVIEYEENNCIHIWVMKDYNVRESWTRSLTFNLDPIGRIQLNCRDVRVLYVLKNSEVLMLCTNGALLCYNPKTEEFRLPFGFPSDCEAVCHVGSLVSPLLRRNRCYKGVYTWDIK